MKTLRAAQRTRTALLGMIIMPLAFACGQSDSFKSLEETKALLTGEDTIPILTRPAALNKVLTENTFKLDFNNERTGDDTDMKYSCTFDRAIDGSVSGSSCDDLPFGPLAKFDTATGKLTWGPLETAGAFELKVEGKNKAGTDSVVFGVDVSLNNLPKLDRITDQTIAALKTLAVKPVNKHEGASTNLSYSCRFDKVIDETMTTTEECRNLPGDPAIKFDTQSGILSWIPPESAVGDYEFEITAKNDYGSDSKVFAVKVGNSETKKVLLSYVRDQVLVFGETLSVDVTNTITNSDDGVSYTCYYDALADGSVNDLLSCDLLPGVPAQKFNPLTGVLNWTPSLQQNTDVEIKIKGLKQSDTDNQVFVVSLSAQRFGEVGNSALVFDPTSWDFGSVALNATSTPKTFIITNNASSDVYLGSISSTATDFIVNWNSCPVPPQKLASLATCQVNVSFRPNTSGQLGASIVTRFGRSAAAATDYNSVLGLSGRGVGTMTFAGLDTITGITHKSLTLNWASTPAAASFLIFQVSGSNLLYLETLVNAGGTVTSKTLDNLTPNTAYTFRVRATDFVGVVDSNTANVTATTLVNRTPSVSDGPSGWQVYSGRTVAALDFNDNYSGNDSDRDGDTISYTCHFDSSIDGSVAVTNVCPDLTNIDGSHPTFNQFTGILAGWKPRVADENLSFEFKITGTDFYGLSTSTTFSTTVVNGAPTINNVTDKVFPSYYLQSNETFSLGFDNIRFSPYSDTDMTYTCTFKRLTTTDSASAACTGLPGTFTLGSGTGDFNWLPGTSGVGAYEFSITGTNLVGSITRTFKVDILPGIDDTQWLFHVDARFADTFRGGQNSLASTTKWYDLTSAGILGTLNNFNAAAAWVGSTASNNPMALVFDGSNDYVSFATDFNTQTSLHFDGWFYQGTNAREKVIFSQGNTTENGIILTDRRLWLGNGTNASYSTAVMNSTPAIYWKFDDISGSTAVDSSGNSRTGLVTNPVNVSNNVDDAVFNMSSAGILTTSTGYIRPQAAYTLGANWTIESWFYYPFPSNCAGSGGWCTLARGNTVADHQIIVQQNTMALGVWKGKAAVTTPANGFLTSGYSLLNLTRGWHHLVAVGSSNTTTFYVDGSAVGSPIAYQPQDDLYFVGGIGSQAFGRVDEFAVYNTALTGAAIQAHYTAGNKSFCSYSMNDGYWYNLAGTIDDASNAVNLYLNGSRVCSFTKSSGKTLAGSTASLTLGRSSVGASTSWAGKMSSLIFYNDAATGNIESNHTATSSLYSPQVPLPPAGLRLWLRADMGLYSDTFRTTAAAADGDRVIAWEDQSGTGGDMQVRANLDQDTARPTLKLGAINGQPALAFDGVNDNLQNAISYGYPNTIFVVGHYNGSSPRGRVVSGTSNNWFMGWHSGFRDRFYANTWIYQPSPVTDNSWQIYATDHSASIQRIFRNNQALQANSVANTQGPVGLNLGSYAGNNEWSISEIAEVIVYERVLTDAERQAVFAYLNARYGIY
ncbi:MAG TPA: LamG-like jellyroll fold domain-containing protein [Oligoflexus sp.]|uniref:LamG-like jellyroll fold domain-containing protein n=1 Tax=Oligoflexus sp. TaxID=1971216 RepID=UPI002D4F55A3|nr:LamG-like jellyroll fold domain-containing protein [Oligoflexus sp.]HYX32521.1 LamG-like jellyroll fold domain-containing protein [Oligoflexus sp.]